MKIIKSRLIIFIVGVAISVAFIAVWWQARQNYFTSNHLLLIAGKPIQVKILLQTGWKINTLAPSHLSLFKQTSDGMQFVKDFSVDSIAKEHVALPALQAESQYRLQGMIYFCEDEKAAFCTYNNYDQQFFASAEQGLDFIEIYLSTNN